MSPALTDAYADARKRAMDETDLPLAIFPGGLPMDGRAGAGGGLLAGGLSPVREQKES